MNCRDRGFTLLEMVVAIGIFAIVASISYAALNNFLDARAHINERNDKNRELQTLFVLLEQDLRYAVNRSVRNEYGDFEPAMIGALDSQLAPGERLRLTTAQPDVQGPDTHRLTRVAWRLIDGDVSRVTWRVLDRDIDSPEYTRELMSDVQEVEFTFFEYQNDEKLATSNEWQDQDGLPAGIEVMILLEGQQAYRRVFQVAGK